MDMVIKGRRALVFGGSRGMGRATAQCLANEGVLVTIAARNPDTLRQAAAEITTATGVPVAPVVADITSEAGRAAAIVACPNPDILINNADGPKPGDFRHLDRDQWIAALDSMMLGPIAMMRAVVDGMIERKFGRIIHQLALGEVAAGRNALVEQRAPGAGGVRGRSVAPDRA